MDSIIDASEIPTITLLYELGRLDWNPTDGLPLRAVQEYNDKVAHIRADITTLRVDAIVNAAKPSLRGGGGVDGAIHHAAGPGLLKECLTLQGCETGGAKITDGYNLPADKVIHSVGPVYGNYTSRESAKYLKNCYRNCLELALENGCKTVAFSALSTGVYGYPSEDAAQIAISEVRDFLIGPGGAKIEKVIFCSFTEPDVLAYEKILPWWFPPVNKEKWEHVAGTEAAGAGKSPKDPDTDLPKEGAKIHHDDTDENRESTLIPGKEQEK